MTRLFDDPISDGQAPQRRWNQHQHARDAGHVTRGETPIHEASRKIRPRGDREHAEAEVGGEDAPAKLVVALQMQQSGREHPNDRSSRVRQHHAQEKKKKKNKHTQPTTHTIINTTQKTIPTQTTTNTTQTTKKKNHKTKFNNITQNYLLPG